MSGTHPDSTSPADAQPSRAHRLFRPVDIASLVFFRFVYGGFLLWHAWRYISRGWIETLYAAPRFHFKYFGFEWVQPWPGGALHMHFYLMAILSLAVILGFYYRAASVLLCFTFWHQFLLEQSRYQNHYYLLGLISFLMIWLPAHRAGSIDSASNPSLRTSTVPAWTLWLLRAQIGIPYFFGGLAKLNGDWLQGEPVRTMLANQMEQPLIGPYVTQEWMVMLVAYGGLLIDLLIVPLLLWRPTRSFAFVVALIFHLMNAALFQIGIFPWFMIAATTVFFSPDWPRRLWRTRTFPAPFGPVPSGPLSRGQRLTVACFAAYLAIQVILPLRHFAYPSVVDWTEEGSRFGWRMMLRDKRVLIQFVATDPDAGRTFAVDPREYLTPRQVGRVGIDPDMVLQFCRYLEQELSRPGRTPVEVRVVAIASLNGRKPQLLIDPTLNLASQSRTLFPKKWIVPLAEPLPEQRWDAPLQAWEEFVDLPPGLSSKELREAR